MGIFEDNIEKLSTYFDDRGGKDYSLEHWLSEWEKRCRKGPVEKKKFNMLQPVLKKKYGIVKDMDTVKIEQLLDEAEKCFSGNLMRMDADRRSEYLYISIVIMQKNSYSDALKEKVSAIEYLRSGGIFQQNIRRLERYFSENASEERPDSLLHWLWKQELYCYKKKMDSKKVQELEPILYLKYQIKQFKERTVGQKEEDAVLILLSEIEDYYEGKKSRLESGQKKAYAYYSILILQDIFPENPEQRERMKGMVENIQRRENPSYCEVLQTLEVIYESYSIGKSRKQIRRESGITYNCYRRYAKMNFVKLYGEKGRKLQTLLVGIKKLEENAKKVTFEKEKKILSDVISFYKKGGQLLYVHDNRLYKSYMGIIKKVENEEMGELIPLIDMAERYRKRGNINETE